jgi:hypothetical protein
LLFAVVLVHLSAALVHALWIYRDAVFKMLLIAANEAIKWPDTPAIRPDGDLIFTSSSLNDHFAGMVKPGHERYDLWRL